MPISKAQRDNADPAAKPSPAAAQLDYGIHHPPPQTPYNAQTRRSALRRMARLPVFFLVFVSSERRRMAFRLYPTPFEMNVKRGFKPTAELTKNQGKT
jgi:hypothetical protein